MGKGKNSKRHQSRHIADDDIPLDEREYIFQFKGIKSKNVGNIKCVGYIHKDEPIIDEPMDKVINITEYVSVNISIARMTLGYILSHKKIPVIVSPIIYNKKFVSGQLFTINLCFEIKNDLDKIKSVDELYKLDLDGKYTLEIIMDDKIEIIEHEIFLGYDDTFKYLKNILESENMREIINHEMKKRDEERREKYGAISDYKISDPRIKLDEIYKRMDNGEELENIIESL